MADPRLTKLGKVPMFSSLSQRHLRKLLKGSLEYEYDPGYELVKQGQTGQTLFVILEGKARVTRRGRKVALLSAGDFFGEIAVLDRRERTATVTAETALRCLVLHRDKLREIVADEPKAAWELLTGLASRLRGD